MNLTTIDLFSGCGGMSLGFQQAGFKSILASDIDDNCKLTFNRNFPDVPFLCKSILDISKAEVDSLIGDQEVDIIIGGPPCQGFSLANKKRNVDDPRNQLFKEFVKFIEWYNPKIFVIENVKGLLSMGGKTVINSILELISNTGLGYNVDYKVLVAADFGVPQLRERVFIVGFRKDLNTHPTFPTPTFKNYMSVLPSISDLPKIDAGEGKEIMEYPISHENKYQRLMRMDSTKVYNHVAMKHTKRLVERFKAIKQGQSLSDVSDEHGAVKRGNPTEKSNIKFKQNNLRLTWNKPAPTIAASFQSNFIHPLENRNLTAREGARLQSFPDTFIFEGMRTKMSWEIGLSQYQQIGNAVPPMLAKALAEHIMFLLK